MKSRIVKLCLLVVALAFVGDAVYAQAAPKRTSTKRSSSTTKKKSTTKKSTAKVTPPPVKDTVKPVVMIEPEIKLDTIRKSLRQDDAIERNLVKDRTPLAYEHIREDDAVYRQRLWREIDVHEKMNLPFVYKADGDNGNQRFVNILLNAIKSGEITAFNAQVDDRFTTPMTLKEIAELLVGKPHIEQVPNWAEDPTGAKGLMKDTVITEVYNPDIVERFWIKEDVIFDKESSRMYTRILGIAPVKTIRNQDGSFRDVSPVFWVYYPELRPLLAKYEAYCGKNWGVHLCWEELFRRRMLSSRIIK